MFDLLITGGTVIDPASGKHEKLDVGIVAGRIAAIDSSLASSAKEFLDASGRYVAPGFVDMHAHVFWGVNFFAVDADPYCTANGITTVVDCGSAGSMNFPGFRRYVIEPARTRILAFVNVAKHGIQTDPGEMVDIAFADPDGTVSQVQQHADIVIGIKVRLGTMMVGNNGPAAYDAALTAAEEAKTHLMVHIGDTPMPIEAILDRLRPGDVVTHCLHNLKEGILDAAGQIRPAVRRARERGVIFDLGHARGMLSLDVARAARAQSFGPDTLSSDAYTMRRPRAGIGDPGLDLPVILSKFLALGWSLDEAIEACTVRPARVMGWDDRLGRLAVGREADVTVFELHDEPLEFRDIEGKTLQGRQHVRPIWTIRSGEPAPARWNPGFRDRISARSYVEPGPPDCCG